MSIERARALHQRLRWTNQLRPVVTGPFFAGIPAPEPPGNT